MRASKIVTEPVREPFTLAEAKDHLRVDEDQSADDAYIASLIRAARVYAESYTHRALLTQTWDMRMDLLPDELEFPFGQLQSVTSVKYLDSNGTEQTVATTVYDVDTYSDPGRLWLAYGQSWPSHRYIQHAVRIRFVCGYGSFGSDVPEMVRHGMLLLISSWYENREPVLVGQTATSMPAPVTVEALLGPYRIARP